MTSNLPSNEEQIELQKELDKIASHPKLARWLQLFLDKTNNDTFGNRTQSAIIAYNLDPIAQYETACQMGSQNFRKLKGIAIAYYEKDGMTAGKVFDLIAAHAVAGKQKALEMLGIITEVYDPKAQILIQNNMQVNNTLIQKTAQEIENAKKDFKEFLENKYRNSTVIDGSAG